MHMLSIARIRFHRAQCGRAFKIALGMALVALMVPSGALAAGAQAQGSKTRATPAARVDVNSADAKLLETLPGVGPVLAQRILEKRPYKDLSELEQVKGLGPAKIEALKGVVVFGPAINTNKTNSGASTATHSGPDPAKKAPNKENESLSASSTGNRPTAVAGTNAPARLAKGEKINLNKATAADLERLPGIGPAKAKAILDYRTRHGDFKSIEEIQKVDGIKAGAFARIKHVVKVTD